MVAAWVPNRIGRCERLRSWRVCSGRVSVRLLRAGLTAEQNAPWNIERRCSGDRRVAWIGKETARQISRASEQYAPWDIGPRCFGTRRHRLDAAEQDARRKVLQRRGRVRGHVGEEAARGRAWLPVGDFRRAT